MNTSEKLMEVFKLGIDYGQLLMELERDSEDVSDAFQGVLIDEKYSMPSQAASRRLPHSEEWRKAKSESLYKALELIGKHRDMENQIRVRCPYCGSQSYDVGTFLFGAYTHKCNGCGRYFSAIMTSNGILYQAQGGMSNGRR